MDDDEKDDDISPTDAVSPSANSPDDLDQKGSDTITKAITEEVLKSQSHESVAPINSYQIKPNLQEKFKEIPVKDILREVQNLVLGGRDYETESVKKWTIRIANIVNEKVKDLEMKRYKHIIQVILGERKGQGVKSGVRCLWDSDVDGYTSEIFMNDTIFCVTTVFAVYLY